MSGRATDGRSMRRWLLRSLLAVVALVALLWLVAAAGVGMGLVIPWALARAAPDGWTVRVGAVDGDWRRRVHIRDLSLVGPPGTLRADALALEYRLLPLLGRTIDLRRIEITKPSAALALTEAATAVEADTAGAQSLVDRLLSGSPLGPWELRLAELRVDGATAVLERTEGAYRIERADLVASSTMSPDLTALSIESLSVEATPPPPPPGESDGVSGAEESDRAVRLDLAARFEDGAVEVRTLELRSARSHVSGAGTLLIAAVAGYVDDVDFALTADPLDLRDLPLALPVAIADDPVLRLRMSAAGPPAAVAIEIESDGPGSSTARAEGLVRFAAEKDAARAESSGDSFLQLATRVSLDLGEWAASPYAGRLTADVDVTWAAGSRRSAPLRAEGTLVHSPPDDAPAGLVGDPLRVDVDVTRTPLPHSREANTGAADADSASAAALDITAVVHRPPAQPSSIDAMPADREWVEVGEVSAQVEGSRGRWQIDLLLDSSSMNGTGEAAWGEGARAIVVDELRVQRLDLSDLVASLPMTSLGGHLSGNVAGASITELAGRVVLSLDSSAVAESRIAAARVDAELVPGSITGTAMVDADAGRVEAEYQVLIDDAQLDATLSRFDATAPPDSADTAPDSAAPVANAVTQVAAAVDSVDGLVDGTADTPSDRTESPAPAWSLRGRAAGTWALGDVRRATLNATLDSSSVGGLLSRNAVLEASLVGDSVTATASADLAALLAAPATVLATARFRGTTLADAVGAARLQATRFHLAEDSTRSGAADSIAIEISASEPGRFVLAGDVLPAEGGRVVLSGGAEVSADVNAGEGNALSFLLEARGSLDAPAELLRGGTIREVALQSSGARSGAGWESFSADVLLSGGQWGDVVADTLRANLHYDSTGIVLDTLGLQSNVFTLSGAGLLPASASGTGSIDLVARFDLEPLRGQTESELPTIGGNELAAIISGTTDSIEVALTSSMTALVHRDVRVSGFEGEASGLFRPPFRDLAGLVSGRARLQLDRISLPHSDIGNLVVGLDGTPEEVRMEVRALVDEARAGEMDARIDPTPDGRSMQVDRLELQLDEDQWRMVQPALLSFRDGIALRDFDLRAGEQAIAIDGGLTAAGALDLRISMDSTDVGTVADLIGFPRLDGWLGGEVNLRGTREAPEGIANLILGYHEEGESPTSARVLLESDGRRVDTDVTMVDPAGGTLSIGGVVPIHEEEPVDLRVDATAFAIGAGVAFIEAEQLEELRGRIDAAFAVTGPRDDLAFDGSLGLRDGRVRSPLLGVTWEEIRVAARGDGRALLIDSATMEAGSGDLTLTGSVVADTALVLDLDVALDDFQAIQTNAYQASISGELHVGGTAFAPEVAGRVTTESLDVYIDERPTDGGLEDVALTAEDFEVLRERFGYVVVESDLEPRTSELLTADVTVEFGRDSWIRSRSTPEMAVAFAGEVDVQVRPGTEPQLQGTLTTIAQRGYIAQFGKRFVPREGTVTLDGPPSAAELDLSATYTVPSHANPDGAEATIVLGVTGTQEELSLTLSSEPPMENADIVSYIATGRPAASTFALGDADAETTEADAPGGGLAEAGAGIAVGQILSSIETAAQTGVGLDVVEIRREGIRGATLAAGKYVSPRLYLGFAQPILRRERDGSSLGDPGGSEIEIEFLTFRNILLNLEGSSSSLSLFLRGRVVY